jgi:hypothetical protein
MNFPEKIIIHSKTGNTKLLDQLVEQFIVDGVKFVAVAGIDCALIEDTIDEIVVGDGSDESRFLLTSSHPGESLEEVVQFTHCISASLDEPQIIEL